MWNSTTKHWRETDKLQIHKTIQFTTNIKQSSRGDHGTLDHAWRELKILHLHFCIRKKAELHPGRAGLWL